MKQQQAVNCMTIFIFLIGSTITLTQPPRSGESFTTDPKEFSLMPCEASILHGYTYFNFRRFPIITDKTHDLMSKNGNIKLQFKLCQKIQEKPKECKNIKDSYGYIFRGGICEPIFFPDQSSFQLRATFKKNLGYWNSELEYIDLRVIQEKYQKFVSTGYVNFRLYCDKEKTGPVTPELKEYRTAKNKRIYNFVIRHESFCGVQLLKRVVFLKQYKMLGLFLALISLPLICFGKQYERISLTVMGFLGGTILMIACISMRADFFKWESSDMRLFLTGTLFIGSVLSAVASCSTKIGVYFSGGFLGFLVGNSILQVGAFFIKEEFSSDIMILIIGISLLLGFLISLISSIKDQITILSTSFIGAQLSVLGIGTFIGNFPDFHIMPIKLQDPILQNETLKIGLVYVLSGFILFLGGIYRQFKKLEKEKSSSYGDRSVTTLYHSQEDKEYKLMGGGFF